MASYVDHSTQTIIEGLTHNPAPVPAILSYHTDATTPPDEMPAKEFELPAEAVHALSQINIDDPNVSPTLLLRRKNRPPLIARISLPPSEYTETPRSPPPTQAPMSPLPAANTLYAGHTPLFPRSLSPLHAQDDPSGPSTPDQEEVLSGPLTLPALPGDGTEEDNIELRVLDARLEKLARRQSDPSDAEADLLSSQKPSVRRSSENVPDEPDGVILKKPKMNFGQPLGQA